MALGLSNGDGLSATLASLILRAPSSGTVYPGPPTITSVDFMATPGTLPPGVTLTRASAGWTFDATGTLVSLANDVPRWIYNTNTLALLGLLNEQAATNGIRNSTGVGLVTGSPGSVPTNWQGFGPNAGLTRTMVGSGVEDGIPYVDVRYNGTPTVSGGFVFTAEVSTGVAALPGQTWVYSAFIRMVAGSTGGGNVSVQQYIFGRAAGGGAAGATISQFIPPLNGAPLKSQRNFLGMVLVDPTITFVDARFSFNCSINVPLDITLRIGGWLLCQMPTPDYTTTPIITSTVAVTRAADVLTVPIANGTYTVDIVRANGTTRLSNVVVTGGAYVVPNDQGALQTIRFTL